MPLVAKTVANPEVETPFATRGKFDDLLDEFFGGKSTAIGAIGKGWRLETNTDGRLRWRWQVKDRNGYPVTYVKADGSLGYKRGSRYVGITQSESAREHAKQRRRSRIKRGGRRATRG